MAVVNLPDSPANGTTQTVGGITYLHLVKDTDVKSSARGGGKACSQVIRLLLALQMVTYGMILMMVVVDHSDGTSNQWVEVIGT